MSTENLSAKVSEEGLSAKVSEEGLSAKVSEELVVVNAHVEPLVQLNFLKESLWDEKIKNMSLKKSDQDELAENNIFQTGKLYKSPKLRELFKQFVAGRCTDAIRLDKYTVNVVQSGNGIDIQIIAESLDHLVIKNRRDIFSLPILIPSSHATADKKFIFLCRDPSQRIGGGCYLSPHLAIKVGDKLQLLEYSNEEYVKVKSIDRHYAFLPKVHHRLHVNTLLQKEYGNIEEVDGPYVLTTDSSWKKCDDLEGAVFKFELSLEKSMYGENVLNGLERESETIRFQLEKLHVASRVKYDLPVVQVKHYDDSTFSTAKYVRRLESYARRVGDFKESHDENEGCE